MCMKFAECRKFVAHVIGKIFAMIYLMVYIIQLLTYVEVDMNSKRHIDRRGAEC